MKRQNHHPLTMSEENPSSPNYDQIIDQPLKENKHLEEQVCTAIQLTIRLIVQNATSPADSTAFSANSCFCDNGKLDIFVRASWRLRPAPRLAEYKRRN